MTLENLPITISIIILTVVAIFVIYNIQRTCIEVFNNIKNIPLMEDLMEKLVKFINALFIISYITVIILSVYAIVQTLLS